MTFSAAKRHLLSRQARAITRPGWKSVLVLGPYSTIHELWAGGATLIWLRVPDDEKAKDWRVLR